MKMHQRQRYARSRYPAKLKSRKTQTDRVAQPSLGHTFARECTMIPFEHSQSSGLDSCACRQVGGGRVSDAATAGNADRMGWTGIYGPLTLLAFPVYCCVYVAPRGGRANVNP